MNPSQKAIPDNASSKTFRKFKIIMSLIINKCKSKKKRRKNKMKEIRVRNR